MRLNRNRRQFLLSTVIACLIVTLVIFNSRATREFIDSPARRLTNHNGLVGLKINSQAYRMGTPSLAEIAPRQLLPEINTNVLMLTRIPGTGAELLVLILQRLEGYNAFKHIRLPPDDRGPLSILQQELLVEEITSIIRQEAIPLTFDGDVRFLNFSTFARQSPAYISLVRDPLDPRVLQRYEKGEFQRFSNGAIAHFCGQDLRCTKRNNGWALDQARANVLQWYPVVGILDDFELTLNAFERRFPYFFDGAVQVYKKLKLKENKSFVESMPLDSRRRDKLKKILVNEIEFYQWLKFRLLNETSDRRRYKIDTKE